MQYGTVYGQYLGSEIHILTQAETELAKEILN
jgi:hypothetical protein